MHKKDPNQKLSIVYEDDGIGFKPNKNTNNGLGLRNIKNRIALLKGGVCGLTHPQPPKERWFLLM